MFDILQGDMTRSKVILTFTCLKMYIARSGDTSGSRTTLLKKIISHENEVHFKKKICTEAVFNIIENNHGYQMGPSAIDFLPSIFFLMSESCRIP